MPMKISQLLAGVLLWPAALCTQPLAAVQLDSGAVQGLERDGTRSFLGIPYAAPPVGELRWRPPQPVANWTEPRAAKNSGPACPQPEDKLYGLTPPVQDEDCLYLDIWAPVQATAPLPVMVWIHGGANRMGAGSLPIYDGRRLARRGAVVVSINYRLGYLGYFAHESLDEEKAGGNFALMDQMQALRWVQRNIAAFGGDPQRVTVFGESAGGANILFLMSSPLAKGLFHRAIVQSGGGWNKPLKPEAMQKSVRKNFELAGVTATDTSSLRQLPARALVEAQVQSPIGFGPFLDGVTTTAAPSAVFEQGQQAQIPLIIGSNNWEASLLKVRGLGFSGKLMTYLPAAFRWYGDVAENSEQRGELLFRDMVFAAPARWLAGEHARQASAWLYDFGHVTQGRRGQVPGAGHAAEIAYVFDNLDITPKMAALADEADRRLAAGLSECWLAFARDGRPDCPLAGWQPYQKERDELLWIEDGAQVRKHPQGGVLDGVREYFGPGSWLGG